MDFGILVKFFEVIIIIEIIDVNDYVLVFDQDLYFFAVFESVFQGERILIVLVQDKLDVGQNVEVEYFIESGNGFSYFFINKIIGMLYF